MLDAHEIVNERGQTIKLLRIRNPWGKENYNGYFNDDDTANWDRRLRQQVKYVNDNDGTFFIDIGTYKAEFESTSIHLDTTNMKHSYYMIESDASTTRADGPYCGFNNCQSTKHQFRVKSSQN